MTEERNGLVIDEDGVQYWYRNGQLHREDSPAIIFPGLGEEWWLHGRLHREDGPAIEFISGYRVWSFRGKFHRLDGPAVIDKDGTLYWYIKGKLLSELEHFNKSPYFKTLPPTEQLFRRLSIR